MAFRQDLSVALFLIAMNSVFECILLILLIVSSIDAPMIWSQYSLVLSMLDELSLEHVASARRGLRFFFYNFLMRNLSNYYGTHANVCIGLDTVYG